MSTKSIVNLSTMTSNIEKEFLWIEAHLKDEITVLDGRKILITGITGFFGWWFLNFFLFLNHSRGKNIKIIGTSRDINSIKENILYPPNGLFLYRIDLKIPFDIKDDYDYVIHMATTSAYETFHGESDVSKINLLENGTKNLLMQLSEKVKKVLFTSSGVVYGQGDRPFIEDDPLCIQDNKNAGLANGKIKAEKLIIDYSKKNNNDFIIARCFSFVGPNLPMDIHYAIGNFIKNALDNVDIVINGDGLPRRSYLYITDTIVWLIKLLVFGKGIYNVGSDYDISIYDLALKVKSLTSSKSKIHIKNLSNESVGNIERNIYLPDISKIRKEMNLDVYNSLNDSILKTILFNSTFK